jgi:hypothetical protein
MGNEIINGVKINYSWGTTLRVMWGNSASKTRVFFYLEYVVESGAGKSEKIQANYLT